ncbi:MAG: hypothetical protein ACPL1K_01350 [Candidatus Kryptoniota bacterium]
MMNSKKKIAIAICTGRKTGRSVIKMLAESIRTKGHHQKHDLYLIVSYDPAFQQLAKKDFMIGERAAEVFSEIIYSGPEDYKYFLKEFGNFIDQKGFDLLFKPRGYCTPKNKALIHALRKNADFILFLDDDEYFTVPIAQPDGTLKWVPQDIVGKHIENLSRAEVTNGAHSGYFSPIPSDIVSKLDLGLRKRLGKVLGIGNEIISEKTFVNAKDFFRCGSVDFLNRQPYEIKEISGAEPLTAGNLGIRVDAIKSGKIPPYFNPIGARGEDVILAIQIFERVKILRIPVYTFHDPFLKYLSIMQGTYPQKIEPIQLTSETIDRFFRACIGWLSYAPLFTRMTSKSESEYKSKIDLMTTELSDMGKQIDRCLGWKGFRQLVSILKKHDQKSKEELEELDHAKKSWWQLVRYFK